MRNCMILFILVLSLVNCSGGDSFKPDNTLAGSVADDYSAHCIISINGEYHGSHFLSRGLLILKTSDISLKIILDIYVRSNKIIHLELPLDELEGVPYDVKFDSLVNSDFIYDDVQYYDTEVRIYGNLQWYTKEEPTYGEIFIEFKDDFNNDILVNLTKLNREGP